MKIYKKEFLEILIHVTFYACTLKVFCCLEDQAKARHYPSFLPSFLDDFRIFCGDLGNEVNDDILARAFSRYPSFLKAKVIRDKRTGKTKGYGFVSFKDPNDYVRAMREMNGECEGALCGWGGVHSIPRGRPAQVPLKQRTRFNS